MIIHSITPIPMILPPKNQKRVLFTGNKSENVEKIQLKMKNDVPYFYTNKNVAFSTDPLDYLKN